LPALFVTLKIDAITFGVGVPFIIVATLLYLYSGLLRRLKWLDGVIYLAIYLAYLVRLFSLL